MTAPNDMPAARAEIEQRDALIAGLRARAKRAGCDLFIIDAGNGTSAFSISRWGRTLDLPDAAAVADWLDRIGAK